MSIALHIIIVLAVAIVIGLVLAVLNYWVSEKIKKKDKDTI